MMEQLNQPNLQSADDSQKTAGQSPVRCRVLFYWDYDTQWGGDRSRSRGGPKQWGHLDFENTERLLELHGLHDVKACFAVVGAAALPGERPYHDPAQIRRISLDGHEIASHSFRHEWLPGLTRPQLMEDLRKSKDALEQCIGEEIRSFVPPFNQPFDYPRKLSFSLSERRQARGARTGLKGLCQALKETGYQFSRVSYRSLASRLVHKFIGPTEIHFKDVERIAGLSCVRLNTPSGFGEGSIAVLKRAVKFGGIVVLCGHPHGLTARCPQNESYLIPFLKMVSQLRSEGQLEIVLPSDLISGPVKGRTASPQAVVSANSIR